MNPNSMFFIKKYNILQIHPKINSYLMISNMQATMIHVVQSVNISQVVIIITGIYQNCLPFLYIRT